MSDSDSDSETKKPERVKTNSSMGYKIKKFVASKTVGTKAGRNLIISLLGNEGDNIMQVLKDAATKFAGKDVAKSLKKDFLSMVLKVKLCADEKRLTVTNTAHMRDPTNNFALVAMKLLNSTAKPVDIEPFVHSFNNLRDMTAELLKPHMQHKNMDKLVNIFNFYGDPAFLDKVFNTDEYEDERLVLKSNLAIIVDDLQHRLDSLRHKPKPCHVGPCPNDAVGPKGSFVGSVYCAKHHLELVQHDLNEPRLLHFTNPASRASPYFVRYLQEASGIEVKSDDASSGQVAPLVEAYKFNDAVVQYKRLRKNLRKARADLIFRKFLKTNAMGLSDGVVEQSKKDLRGVSKLRTVFDAPVKEAVALLQTNFDAFLKSIHFSDYAATVKLPSLDNQPAAKK